MINSKVIEYLEPMFKIIGNSKGKTIGQIKRELNIEREKMKKGASGLIVENLLGIKNNNISDADIPEIGCEVKILPLQKNKNGEIKAKEPTAIQMINYFEVAKENWETEDDYIIVDYFLSQPDDFQNSVFRKDWELIRDYIISGRSDDLSCSMGEYLEPKTKGANRLDLTDAPDGKGGSVKVRRRAFYYKKHYTDSQIIPHLDLDIVKQHD